MKIEDIEKACKLNKELKEIEEILEAELDKVGCPSSFILMLYHNNKRFDLNSLLTQEARTKIMDIIFDDCKERAKQIEQEIKDI